MNVTIKIDNELVKGARHRAVDDGLSLSGWIAQLLSRELALDTSASQRGSLLAALGNDELAERKVDFPRDQSPAREVDF